MKYVEKAGLVKFDFLGLKTLTVIDKAQRLIRTAPAGLRYRDDSAMTTKATYHMLGQGDTVGVFQLESSGMRDVLRKMHADRFEDLIALVALYRPGPMANIPDLLRRKLGEEPSNTCIPGSSRSSRRPSASSSIRSRCSRSPRILAGYTLGEADLLRRAMGKKIKSEMDAQRSASWRAPRPRASIRPSPIIFSSACAKFADYGFNKSHSACLCLSSAIRPPISRPTIRSNSWPPR